MDLRFEDEALSVHQQLTFAALDLLSPYSMPRSSPPTPVVFTNWESTMPALG
jgi:hypothetical protein